MFTVEDIQTVKKPIGANSLLVNDKYNVPEVEGNRHYRIIQEWLAGGPGRFIEEPTQEELDAYEAAQLAETKKQAVRDALQAGQDMIIETKILLDGLTIDEAQALINLNALAPVQSLLQNGSLATAQTVFQGLDLTGTSITEEMRTELVASLAAKISEIETRYGL